MGNISPRQSKSCHDGFPNQLTLTPNRSSWKKQLQIINQTLNIKKFSLRHGRGKHKKSRTTIDENNHHSFSIQNFGDLNEKLPKSDQREMNVRKSSSLFVMKQPLIDSTNKENRIKVEQPLLNSTTNDLVQHRRRSKTELTTVNMRHSTFIPPTYHLPKSQSQIYRQYQIQLSSKRVPSTKNNHHGLSSSTKHVRSTEIITRRTIIQASTSELLRCLSEYLCSSCAHLSPILDPIDCIIWIKSADRQLILQGWQEQVFVNPANIVFVYLIVRDTLTHVVPSTTIKSVSELHSIILTCLYLAFSYMGHEITYPLKPFVTDNETREVFWQRVVLIMRQSSSKMLAINQNPKFFTECFSELKEYNLVH